MFPPIFEYHYDGSIPLQACCSKPAPLLVDETVETVPEKDTKLNRKAPPLLEVCLLVIVMVLCPHSRAKKDDPIVMQRFFPAQLNGFLLKRNIPAGFPARKWLPVVLD
jgi:hypothetical protein